MQADKNNSQKERKVRKEKRIQKWYMFFTKWTFYGIILILSSLIILISDFKDNIFVAIFSQLIQTIGIALLIGAVFDFAKNSKEFTEFISKILSDIIVSKSFLTELSDKDKKKALSLILQPSDNQLEQYSNINEYFRKKIEKAVLMFNTNFKTNLVLYVDVIRDENSKLITSKGILTYRIYKAQNRYEPILITFENDNSELLGRKIIFPGGIKELKKEDLKPFSEFQAGINYKKYVYEIPEEFHKYPYLTIESEIFEPGYDHWTNFRWTSLTPYDGFSFTLKCMEGLVIKQHTVFDEKNPYIVQQSSDNKTIRYYQPSG